MMLTAPQRERLAAIEEACMLLEAREQLLTLQARRVAKLKSPKHLEAAKTKLTSAQQERLDLELFVRDETASLFADAFGVGMDMVVRVMTADGRTKEPFVVNQVRARQLSNGLGVFFVAGDSLERNVNDKQPVPVMFNITENSGDELVVEG